MLVLSPWDGVKGTGSRDVMNCIHLSSTFLSVFHDSAFSSYSSATSLLLTLFHSTPQASNIANPAITVDTINVASTLLAYAINLCRNLSPGIRVLSLLRQQ